MVTSHWLGRKQWTYTEIHVRPWSIWTKLPQASLLFCGKWKRVGDKAGKRSVLQLLLLMTITTIEQSILIVWWAMKLMVNLWNGTFPATFPTTHVPGPKRSSSLVWGFAPIINRPSLLWHYKVQPVYYVVMHSIAKLSMAAFFKGLRETFLIHHLFEHLPFGFSKGNRCPCTLRPVCTQFVATCRMFVSDFWEVYTRS